MFPDATGAGPDRRFRYLSNIGDTFTFIERPALQSARMIMHGQAYGRTMIRPFIPKLS
jgi:hypothetical protein